MPFAIAFFHKSLQVIYFESLTILFVGKVEKANDWSLFSTSPNKTLGNLICLKVHYFFILIAAMCNNSALSFCFLLFDNSPGKHLVAGIGLFQIYIKRCEL